MQCPGARQLRHMVTSLLVRQAAMGLRAVGVAFEPKHWQSWSVGIRLMITKSIEQVSGPTSCKRSRRF